MHEFVRFAALNVRLGRLSDCSKRGSMRTRNVRPSSSKRVIAIAPNCIIAALAAAAAFAAGPLVAQQPSLGVTSGLTAAAFRYQIGRRVTYACPASSTSTEVAVWGTDVYSFDSAVCLAAIHAGVLGPQQAGAVTFTMGPGAESFTGSARNGVTSADYTGYDSGFSFDRSGEPGRVDGMTTLRLPEGFGTAVTVICPLLGTFLQPLWGTDVYADDSSICAAAAHAGLITLNTGGGGQSAVERSAALIRGLCPQRCYLPRLRRVAEQLSRRRSDVGHHCHTGTGCSDRSGSRVTALWLSGDGDVRGIRTGGLVAQRAAGNGLHGQPPKGG